MTRTALVLCVTAVVTSMVCCDLLTGVQLVTDLSNSLVPKLFQALAPGRENLVFAPFGLATNLAMILEASREDTAREILSALNLSPESLPDLRIGFKAYCDSFEATADNEEVAGSFNTAAMKTSHPLSSTYKSILDKFYRANITETSKFDNFTGVRPTGVKLELRSDSGVMSHWKDFDRLAAFSFLSHEPSAPFYRSPNNPIPVPMIPQVGTFRAARLQQLNAHAVELPLEVSSVVLLLLVPDSGEAAVDELLVRLPTVSLQQLVQEWLPQRPTSEISVSIPQMAVLTAGVDLTPFLRQLGIRKVFNSSAANLSGANSNTRKAMPVYVKSITQDAYFTTSFVAVNSVGSVSTNFVSRRRPKRQAEDGGLVVNRPFLFFLLHRDTQLVLLAGKVQNPTQVP